MKKTKTTSLLIKLAVVCVLTFGLFYIPARADMYLTCINNCRLMKDSCQSSIFTCNFFRCTCEKDYTDCLTQCSIVTGNGPPPHAPPYIPPGYPH